MTPTLFMLGALAGGGPVNLEYRQMQESVFPLGEKARQPAACPCGGCGCGPVCDCQFAQAKVAPAKRVVGGFTLNGVYMNAYDDGTYAACPECNKAPAVAAAAPAACASCAAAGFTYTYEATAPVRRGLPTLRQSQPLRRLFGLFRRGCF